MRHIIDYSKEKRLRRVDGDVLAENTTMLQMCPELSFQVEDIGSGMRRVAPELENIGGRRRSDECVVKIRKPDAFRKTPDRAI